MNSEAVLGVWGYEITSIEHSEGAVRIQARYSGVIACPDCSGERLRSKGRYVRTVRHETWGMRHCFLILEARTVSRHSEVAEGQRSLPADDFLPSLGWN